MNLSIDLSQVSNLEETLIALRDVIGNSAFTTKVNAAIQAASIQSFYEFADAMAEENRRQLHHVYEWGMIGEERGRLFEVMSTGVNQYASKVYYDFKESVVPRPGVGLPSDEEHVFVYKAWIMEQGGTTTVYPLNASVLAIPVDDGEYTMHEDLNAEGQEIIFRPSAKTRYDANVGEFAAIWNTYWLSINPQQIRLIADSIERSMTNRLRHSIRDAGTTRFMFQKGAGRPGPNKMVGGFSPHMVTVYAHGTDLNLSNVRKVSELIEQYVLQELNVA